MRNTYSASEIKKMLKLTTDALRFYEKKGLVHPEIKEDNHDRSGRAGNQRSCKTGH